MTRAYYNEIDPYCAAWLRALIAGGHIAPGDVDERSIVDVRPDDLRGYSQCHFFGGLGGWSLALRLAGWPADRPVWTGSCPCQPFSAAGKGKAADDDRHLWPAWFSLIAECRPATIFGEQVEAAIGWGWLDAVFADLESEGYACGATVLPACGVGAPHIRQRLWFVANAVSAGRPEGRTVAGRGSPAAGSTLGVVANARCDGREGAHLSVRSRRQNEATSVERGIAERLADTMHPERRPLNVHREDGCDGTNLGRSQACGNAGTRREVCDLGNTASERRAWLGDQSAHALTRQTSPWANLEWLRCTDGKARPTQPGVFPLAHAGEFRNRVALLRAAGNAIVPQVAAEFIAATIEAIDSCRTPEQFRLAAAE